MECGICPRRCRLREGQRGFCFVRGNVGGAMVLLGHGRSSGFWVDPIEKKPLNHFLPGTPVLSFGTVGCNLACRFCQNWSLSKARDPQAPMAAAPPEAIARGALDLGCRSVAFTYNDPVIFHEYCLDTAQACRALGLRTVAVSAGYQCPGPGRSSTGTWTPPTSTSRASREAFYRAAVRRRACSRCWRPWQYIRRETRTWLEITTLLIPGENDSPRGAGARYASGWPAPGAGRAPALLRLPPGLEAAGPAAHAPGHPAGGPAHRPGQRRAPRVRGQRGLPRRRRAPGATAAAGCSSGGTATG